MKDSKRTYINNELIVKYLKKVLSDAETLEVTEWLQADQANQDFLFGLEELYQVYCWDELKLAANTTKEWEKLEKLILSKKHNTRHLPVWKTVIKYATAAACLIFATSYIIWQTRVIHELQSPVTIATVNGQRSEVILPDGTKVWLNACSQVSYTNAVFAQERRVQMTGEAYFEVAKNPKIPFIVQSKQVQTRVLGTKFNIRAYPDENFMSATLLEGSIQLSSKQKKFPRQIIMKPGEKIICYDEDGEAQYAEEEVRYSAIDWISGKLHFDNRTLYVITRELEKHFNTTINFATDSLKTECFTCHFENDETLQQILNILKLTRKFDYEVKDNKIVLIPMDNH